MKTRTSEKTVTFTRPFALAGLEEVLPAGDYSVETEEELIEGISYAAYRQTATVLHLPARSGPPHLTRAMAIDPEELDAALACDQGTAEALALAVREEGEHLVLAQVCESGGAASSSSKGGKHRADVTTTPAA